MIRAEVHTDDHRYEIKFDATEYFEQVPDEPLIRLAIAGWGGDYPADWVAQFYDGYDREITKMFRYLQTPDSPGFEVHVNEEDALKWIKKNRPDLFRKIKYGFGPREWAPKTKKGKKEK